MNIKILFGVLFICTVSFFTSCNDDANSVGSSIQPSGDGIFVGVDSVYLSARTQQFDSIYARTNRGALGKYESPVLGKIKSDYLCEFFVSDKTSFPEKIISIDSAKVNVLFEKRSFVGDSILPMGITAYELNRKLDPKYNTNIDPSKYCDMSKYLGSAMFTVNDARLIEGYKYVTMDLKQAVGQRFYDEWKRSPSTFTNQDSFRDFFPGIYVTPTFGSGTVVSVRYTLFDVYYKYKPYENYPDSVVNSYFRLTVTPEVIQMNSVQNKIPQGMVDATPNPVKTYANTPGGLYTEISIPLKKIAEKAGADKVINSAPFRLIGYTEEEASAMEGLGKPDILLFVNKDSLDYYLSKNPRKDNAVTSFLLARNAGGVKNNSYSLINTVTQVNSNLGPMLNHYINYYKQKGETIPEEIKYVVVPVVRETELVEGTTNIHRTKAIYNIMMPTGAVFRTSPDHMKMKLIFSKYNTQ